jgi:hypothetical protein
MVREKVCSADQRPPTTPVPLGKRACTRQEKMPVPVICVGSEAVE